MDQRPFGDQYSLSPDKQGGFAHLWNLYSDADLYSPENPFSVHGSTITGGSINASRLQNFTPNLRPATTLKSGSNSLRNAIPPPPGFE